MPEFFAARPRETVVCIPTYNERRSLPETLPAVRRALPEAGILVIDDASPDGTGALANGIAAADPAVAVLHRLGKAGLGAAYLDAFGRLLADEGVRHIVQMDADGSHPPEALPALVGALGEAELAVGSRYAPGGAVRDWGLPRRILSRFGSAYARAWLGLPVRDPTGGFKAWRRTLLARVLAYPIRTSGYAFQVETTHIAHRLGARIREVPIVFADRAAGRSKMSGAIALEAAWAVPRMRRDARRWGAAHESPREDPAS